jgi:hypothetical protein
VTHLQPKTKSTKSSKATPAATPPVAPAAAPPAVASPLVQPAPAASPQPTLITGPGSNTSSTGATHATKVDVEAQYQSVIAGLLAYYQPADTFTMSDGTYTRDELIAKLQSFVAAVEQSKSNYQTWRTGVAQERSLLIQVQPLRVGVRGIVQARFGKKGPQVLQFGFTPMKTPVRSAEEKALAARKAVATRKARGTVGKKERATITGATTPAAAPVTPAAPPPTTTPAAASPTPSPVTPVTSATPAAPAPAADPPAVAPPAPAAPSTPQH